MTRIRTLLILALTGAGCAGSHFEPLAFESVFQPVEPCVEPGPHVLAVITLQLSQPKQALPQRELELAARVARIDPGIRLEYQFNGSWLAAPVGYVVETLSDYFQKIQFRIVADACPQAPRTVQIESEFGYDEVPIRQHRDHEFTVEGQLPPPPPPTGDPVVFATYRDGDFEIYGQDGDVSTRLTDDPASDRSPVWSPDKSQIAFVSDRHDVDGGFFELYVMNADGSGVERITGLAGDGAVTVSDPAWSPDGATIAFVVSGAGVARAIYSVPAGGGLPNYELERPLANAIVSPTWSADSARLAFEEDGKIFVFDVGDVGSVVELLPDGSDPDWLGDRIVFTRAGNLHTYNVQTQLQLPLLETAESDVSPAFGDDISKVYFVRQTGEPRVMMLENGLVTELPGQSAGNVDPDG